MGSCRGFCVRKSHNFRFVAACILLLAGATPAAEPTPLRLEVSPAEIEIFGAGGQQQVLVAADFGQDGLADVTGEASFEAAAPVVALAASNGIVVPRGDGETRLIVRYGGVEAVAPIRIREFATPPLVDFRSDVIAALSKAGCNSGACHGSPQGKNGFRLSLRGFDPNLDFAVLTHDQGGRRTNPLNPEESLILLKGTAAIAHQGGRRFSTEDPAYRTLLHWIGQNVRDSAQRPRLVRLEVLPAKRRLHSGAPRQRLIAVAHFSDGARRDVTPLTVFSTSNDKATSIDGSGLLEFHATAETVVLGRYLDKVTGSQIAYVEQDSEFQFSGPPEANAIDRLVFARQRQLQLRPAPLAGDAVFLRRVYLDAIGTSPNEQETRAFLDSTSPDKRARLIDALLEREEYAAFWALKWADIMRGNRATISERGVFSFQRYLVDQFAADRPFDQFARETLTGLGNTLRRPEANFYRIARIPEDAAEGAAQLFLGVRIQCAKCHNHPFESLSQDDYYGLAAYFARVKFKGSAFGLDDETVYLDRGGELRHPTRNENVPPAAFGEPAGEMGPDDDRRQRLADWLVRPDNPWFASSTVNRVWYHLLGRGIVHPVDDFRQTNPPASDELLDYLAGRFAQEGYRLKPLVREILNSSTYQLSAEPAGPQSKLAADPEPYFTQAAVRMLTAEQILDAISLATGVPETFAGYPTGTRAIEVAEGGIEHHFLTAFSKPARDVGCDCAREDEPTLSQVLHLVNNARLLEKVRSSEGRIARWLAAGLPPKEMVERLYLVTLSRRPTADEQSLVEAHLSSAATPGEGLADVQHALINSNEFLLRH